MTGRIEARFLELGVTLPVPPAPVASYVPTLTVGNLVFVSGQISSPGLVGVVGKDLSVEKGKEAARACAINLVAQIKQACGGDLDRVKRCIKLTVYVNATPDFTQHPEVANGASDFIVEVFGETGKHTRSALGAVSLPRGVAVEVEAIFEIE